MAAAALFGPRADLPDCIVCLHGMSTSRDSPSDTPAVLQLSAAVLDCRDRVAVPVAFWHTLIRPARGVEVTPHMLELLGVSRRELLSAPPLRVALASFHTVINRVTRAVATTRPASLRALTDALEGAPPHTFELSQSAASAGASFHVADSGSGWHTVLSPLTRDGEYEDTFCELQKALRGRKKGRASFVIAADGPWILGCDLAKQCIRHGIHYDLWKPYMSDWWNTRWSLCETLGIDDAHRLRARDQGEALGLGALRARGPTRRVQRLARLVQILLVLPGAYGINDSLVPNETVLSRRHIAYPRWDPADEAWELARLFPSRFAD
ncbi:hypothetical protein FNF31_04608 [Cafeteria roenbergensis]|uniref:Uncharacterized protein n=1 Tax=Cafeteria roenbergensis TaxID=33653 RepID=A0A5A8D3E1_CAFRO|nr:hypothetical protein FNF31_04608 [Cafeteria roenbergensis]